MNNKQSVASLYDNYVKSRRTRVRLLFPSFPSVDLIYMIYTLYMSVYWDGYIECFKIYIYFPSLFIFERKLRNLINISN